MNITKVIAVALISVVIIAILRQNKPEFAMHASIIAGIIILYFVLEEFVPLITMVQSLSEKIGVTSKFFIILLKITGVAYLSEFGANICKDSGESAIASKVELAGKVLIISLSIPIITALMETLLRLI